MKPVRLEFSTQGSVSDDECRANVRYSASLNLPKALHLPKASGPLAVCGGGPSLAGSMLALRTFSGDIWAINGTCAWLARRGIFSTFVSVHPGPWGRQLAESVEGIGRAFLASSCAPELFDALIGREVYTFDIEAEFGPDPISGGSTTADRMPMLALRRGYSEVHFFGCEGSFGATTHTFKDARGPDDIVIDAGGKRYATNCQMMLQSETLATLIREFPRFLHDRSGGLLGAMIDHPETWSVVEPPKGGVHASIKAA